jgi:hypothetical protein
VEHTTGLRGVSLLVDGARAPGRPPAVNGRVGSYDGAALARLRCHWMVVLTRWDARVLVRAALVAGLALGLAWLVTAATDEGGISWGERAGRTLPLTPACAAVGAWAALAPVRARGEALALAALGRSRMQVAAAAVAGGALVALVAAVAIDAAPSVDVAAFFPRAARASAWMWDGDGFVDRAQGLRVTAEGTPLPVAAPAGAAASSIPVLGRASAAIATAVAGLALPLVVAHALLARMAPGARPASGGRAPQDRRNARDDAIAAFISGGCLAASLVLFQAAAARHVPALLGAAPTIALLAFAIGRYRSAP